MTCQSSSNRGAKIERETTIKDSEEFLIVISVDGEKKTILNEMKLEQMQKNKKSLPA